MDEPKTAASVPVRERLGLPEICEMITAAEAKLGRTLSPVDFGHDDVIRRTNPEIDLPSLSELRRIFCLGDGQSAYSFVMRATNHTTDEIAKAIHRDPPRRSQAPAQTRVRRVNVEQPEEPPHIEPQPAKEQTSQSTPIIERIPEPKQAPDPPAPEPAPEKPKEKPGVVHPLIPLKGWGDRIVPIKKPESR